jgi:hypothetical protein
MSHAVVCGYWKNVSFSCWENGAEKLVFTENVKSGYSFLKEGKQAGKCCVLFFIIEPENLSVSS